MSISSVLFLSCNRICSASASRFFCRNWSLSASNAWFLSRNSSPSSLEAFSRSSNSVSTSDLVLWRGSVWFAGSSGTPHDFRYSVASPTFFNHSSFCRMPRLINNFQSILRLSIYRKDVASPIQSPRDRSTPTQDNKNQIKTTTIKSFEHSINCTLPIDCNINQSLYPFPNHTLAIPFSVPSSHNWRLERVPLPPRPWSCVLRRVNSQNIHCKTPWLCQQNEPSHQTRAPFAQFLHATLYLSRSILYLIR